jgi:hypothetical protein
MTTADLAARILNDRAGPDDVIIVNPWYAATSFNYYYSGKAPFFSIPPIENYQIQHADLVAAKLSDPNAIEPLKRKISTALSTGHLVWFVGGLQLQLANWQTAKWVPDTSGTLPERRTRAILLWNAEIGQEVQPYLGGASRVPLGAAANSYENLSLTVINPNVVTH